MPNLAEIFDRETLSVLVFVGISVQVYPGLDQHFLLDSINS